MAPLRLRAIDTEDLAVMSAVLQDACAPLKEMAYDAEAATFMAAFNRCCREQSPAKDTPNCLAVLTVAKVRGVTHRGFAIADLERVHHLVLILEEPEPADNEGAYVTLVFRDGSAIRLEVDGVDCRLEDLDAVGLRGEASGPAADA